MPHSAASSASASISANSHAGTSVRKPGRTAPSSGPCHLSHCEESLPGTILDWRRNSGPWALSGPFMRNPGRPAQLSLTGSPSGYPDQNMTVQPAFPPISSVTASTRDFALARFLIEEVYPSLEQGRYPVKRVQGEPIQVWADIFRDGHDVIAAALIWRREGDKSWRREAMRLHEND